MNTLAKTWMVQCPDDCYGNEQWRAVIEYINYRGEGISVTGNHRGAYYGLDGNLIINAQSYGSLPTAKTIYHLKYVYDHITQRGFNFISKAKKATNSEFSPTHEFRPYSSDSHIIPVIIAGVEQHKDDILLYRVRDANGEYHLVFEDELTEISSNEYSSPVEVVKKTKKLIPLPPQQSPIK